MGRAINAIANGFMCSLSLLPTYFYQQFPKNFPGLHLKYDPMAPKPMCFLNRLSVSRMYLHFRFKCLSTRVLNHGKCYCLSMTVMYFCLDYCYKFCGAFYRIFPPISQSVWAQKYIIPCGKNNFDFQQCKQIDREYAFKSVTCRNFPAPCPQPPPT